MGKSLRMLLAGVASVGISVVAAPAAHAAGESIAGGCFATSVENPVLTDGQHQGVVGDVSVTRDANGAPVFATVYCWIQVNYGPATPYVVASGLGVQANAGQVSYTASPGDDVELCEMIDFGGVATASCRPEVIDVSVPGPTIGPVNQVFPNDVDPLLCPELVALGQEINGGGLPGLLEIRSDGDIYVADPLGLGYGRIYDCPTYGN